ncbi:murein biosynthesis integral membrane protein MurJ [Wolbachia endosymbiont of Chironomus riparius]|uniref:murein biosynthesis integral membrane protein MurJ n=1 Tax=Wolbachia endosymbiont of Chironomus riparius TaxID=2883238 RepID=UPI0020A20DBA|nr:murein biosynthesis integral membrane protein MurJ [Wolbachia endosymbiont of Chironomus riparius]
MFKSIFTFGFFTAISRISGLIRDVLIARTMGASSLTDIFFSSFRLANLFRAFFAEGAFTTSFVPIYSGESHDNKKAFEFASSVISITLIILIVFCLVMEIFSPYMVKIFTPGFSSKDDIALTVTLSRIMLPYIVFISIASLIGGMLQVKQHFASTAISPIILNLSLIISLFLPYIQTPAHNLSIAVLIGGTLQLLFLIFSAYKLKANFSLSIKLGSKVKLFFKRVIPAIINNCVTQISVWIDTIMASFLPNAVSYIYYAERLIQLPQGVIGVAIGTVLLPLISNKENDEESIIKIQDRALNAGLILILPITAAFIMIPDIILLTLFSYGKFDYNSVQQTVPTLIAFSLSLPAFIINKILLQAFFAKGELRIPTIFSLICLGINIILNFLLMNKYQHTGIAVATSISTWVNSIFLISYSKRNRIYKVSQLLLLNILKIFISTIIMLIFLYVFRYLSAGFFSDNWLIRIVYLIILIFLSSIVYFSTLYLIFMRNLNNLKYI